MINNSFVSNSAPSGGGFSCGACDANFANNILVANVGGNCSIFGSPGYGSLGGNIDAANTCLLGMNDLINTDSLVVAGAPAANGGFTNSILLQVTSPAIGYGQVSKCPVVDQRGIVRSQPCASGATQ